MLRTTLRLLREHDACALRYYHLVAALGDGWVDDAPISLERILETNGINDALWTLRAVTPEQASERNRIARLSACDCAEAVLPLFERDFPADNRPREAIRLSRLFAHGEATEDQLAAASDAAWAAWAAAWAAARAAASDAAWAAASDAASDAAWAASAAARAAAWAAASARQADRLRQYLRGEVA
jgi:hypothetical protein